MASSTARRARANIPEGSRARRADGRERAGADSTSPFRDRDLGTQSGDGREIVRPPAGTARYVHRGRRGGLEGQTAHGVALQVEWPTRNARDELSCCVARVLGVGATARRRRCARPLRNGAAQGGAAIARVGGAVSRSRSRRRRRCSRSRASARRGRRVPHPHPRAEGARADPSGGRR